MKIFKVVSVLFLIGFFVFMYTDGGMNKISFDDIKGEMKAQVKMSDFNQINDKGLMKLMGINQGEVSDYLYLKSKYTMIADEMLVVKVSNKGQLAAIEKKVEARTNSQAKVFGGYAPKEAGKVNNYIFTTRGVYGFYGVAKEVEEWEKAFNGI
ncbi:MAG: DUF4358 domain-containing protein [Anaerovoracaceae bacterium]